MEPAILWPAVALLGLCFGSLATLLSHRLPLGQKVGATRSRCPNCSTVLSARDLVPLASWSLSRGRCRHCAAPVHWRYPAIELACAGLWLLCFWHFGLTAEFAVFALLATCLLVMTITDLEHTIIPDEAQVFALVLAAAWQVWRQDFWPDAALAAVAGLLVGLALHYGYFRLRGRHGLGLADVKFLAVAGMWLADPAALLPFLFYSGVVGTLLGLAWTRGMRGAIFPFGPALAWVLLAMLLWPGLEHAFWQAPLRLADWIISG